MSSSLDIPSSSGIVIVDNTSSNETLVKTVPREHLPIHHIQQQQHHPHQSQTQFINSNNDSNQDEYSNLQSTNVIDTTNQNTLQTGVINFTTNDVLSNTQVLKFISDDSGTIIDQSNEEIQNYCATGRLITNPTSKVHVISNVPFTSNNKQIGGQQTINLVSNGKITQTGVNFVNAYYAKPGTMQGGKILNLPVKATTNPNQMQQQIINKGGNQLKVSVPRNVQFVTRTTNAIAGGNIIMSRSGQNNNVIQTKGQQILVPQNNIKSATITNNIVKNKTGAGAQLQSVKIFQGGNAQSQKCTTLSNASTISGIKTIIPSQHKITNVKTSSTTVGGHKFTKQFSPINNNYCANTAATINSQTFVSQHQQIQSQKGAHLSQQQANLIYTACNANTNGSNNGSVTKVQTVQYQRAGNLNNVLIQGKGILKGNKYVVQHNPNQTHIVLPQTQSSGNLVAVSGTVTNVQQLKSLPHSFTTNNSGTIKYVNAQGNVTQPPTKVRAIFQQHSSPTILQQNQQVLEHSNDSTTSSITLVNTQHSPSLSHTSASSAAMEEMIVNGTIMTEEEMSARILQSLSQKTIFTNNRTHNQINNNNNNNSLNNNNKIYTNSPNSQNTTKVYLTQNQEHNIINNNINSHQIYHISGIGHGIRDNMYPNHHHLDMVKSTTSSAEKYFKVSSCDLSSTTTTFIDNIPLTSTRGDNIPHGQRAGEDDDELIGEEVRPAPMNVADGKVHLLQVIVQDHTYAAVQPEQTKKVTTFQVDNVPMLSAANIQQAGLNYNFKTNNNNDDDVNSVISTGSRNGVNQLDNDLGEETETAPEGEGEDDSVTRCICDLTHDDGYMICCDKCSAWQHVDCMGIDRQNIPEEYKCEVCQPRPVDKQRARNLQLTKRKEQQNVLLNNNQQQHHQITLENNTQILGQQMERTNLLNKSNSLQNVGKKHKQTVKQRKAELATQFALQKRERKLSSRSNGKRRDSKKISKRKSKMNPEALHNEKTSNLRAWIENYEQAITNHYSPELRARLHAIGKQNQIIKELIPSHLRHTSNLEHRCTTVPHAGGKILISTSDLAANVPIVEIRGKYMLSSQFRQQQAIPSTTGNMRNHQYNRKPGPFIFFYRLPNDGPEICIDTRTYGNEARFVRRSCRPNAEILHSIEKGAIHLYIVSLSNIIGGTEITIKHEPHDLTAISRGNVTSPTSTVCACGCPKDCIFAIATANHLNNISQKAMKKLNGHLIDETRLAYRRSKSLMARGRSTSSSGDSNVSLLSPNNSSMSCLSVLQPLQPITIPLITAPTTPLSSDSGSVFSPQPQSNQQYLSQPQLAPPPTPVQTQPQILQPSSQIIESISMPSPSRPVSLNVISTDHLILPSKMPTFPIDISTMIPPMNVVEKTTSLPLSPAPLGSPVQSVMPMPIVSSSLVNLNKTFSSQNCVPQQQPQIVLQQIHKKTPIKVRQISFSEESLTPIITGSEVIPNIVTSSSQEDSQKSSESVTTTSLQKLDKPPTREPKEKDSPKLTREERKMQAIMKAFEKMEKNQERKQQLKQNKGSMTSTKRRNSSPSSPRGYKDDGDQEKNYHPRKKKRKGSKSYQHLSNPKIRRRSRMNSGDSDLLTSEESTSLLSPPLPPGHQISYSMDDIKSPEIHHENPLEKHLTEKNVNSAAGLLLSLSNSHESQESSTTTNLIPSSNNNNSLPLENNNTLITVANPLQVSSACLLVEAAVAPLEQTHNTKTISTTANETEIKFHVQKTKTKKSIMNDWLNQADSSSTIHESDETTNLDSLVQVAATMCNNLNSPQIVTHSQIVPVTYAIQEEPHNLSMAAKKVEEFIYQNDVKVVEEEENRWHHPNNNLPFSTVTSESNTAISFVTPPGTVVIQDGSGSAAKKRWLRQAISEECDNEVASPPNGGYMTPLKKRRFARQCSDLPIQEDIPSNRFIQTTFCVNDVQQIPQKSFELNSQTDTTNNSPIKSIFEDQIPYSIKIEETEEEIKEESMQKTHSVMETFCDVESESQTNVKSETQYIENHVQPQIETRTYSIVESNPQYVDNHPQNITEENYEQDDEIDIVSSPPPGDKIVAEDNLVKIEPEDENEKDEKIDVVEDVSPGANEIKVEPNDHKYNMVDNVKTEAGVNKTCIYVTKELKHEIDEIFGTDDKQEIKKFDNSDIKPDEPFMTDEDEIDVETQIKKCINATDESINDADDEAEGEEDNESVEEPEFENNQTNYPTVEHVKDLQIVVCSAEIKENEDEKEETNEEFTQVVEHNTENQSIENISNAMYTTEESDKSFESEIHEIKEKVDMEIDTKDESELLTSPSIQTKVEIISTDDVLVEDTINSNEDSRNTSTPLPPLEDDRERDPISPLEPKTIALESKLLSVEQNIISSETESMLVETKPLNHSELGSTLPIEIDTKKNQNEEFESDKPNVLLSSTLEKDNFELLSTEAAIESEECNNVNDEIADIQKRLHSFHTENILILKSRNKKTKPNIVSMPISRSPKSRKSSSPTKPTTPPLLPSTKSKKSVQLNFDLSVQDDMTVNVKLKDKNDPITISNEEKVCMDSKREQHKDSKPVTDIKDCTKIDISKEERHHTRWDKPDEVRYETQLKISSSIYPYLNNNNSSNTSINNTSNTSSIYGITSLSGATNLSQLPPTIHIPPNTPASHIQYYNAFYNKYSSATPTSTTLGSSSAPVEVNENSKLKYPSFSLLSDYLDTASTCLVNSNKITSFHPSTYSGLDTSSTTQQPTYYSSMGSNGPSLISSFLSKSYSSDQITAIQPPKILSRAQSADPRLNPNLNVPEPPPAPKRKLSINEYRKRKQQSESSNTNNGDKTISKSSSTSSLLNDCLGGSGGKSESVLDIKDTLRQIDEKEKEVLFSPAPTELEMQQEILSERLKSFKSLHGLSSLPQKSDDNGSLPFITPLKDKDLESSLSRSNRLSTGSNSSSSSSFSSITELNPTSPLSSSLPASPTSNKH